MTPIPPGGVSAADLYSEVSAARRDVAQILTKVEVMDDRHARQSVQLGDHESRLRALETYIPPGLSDRLTAVEHWQWRAAGIVAAFAVLGGVVAGFLEAVVSRIH